MVDALYASLVHKYLLGLVLTGSVTKKIGVLCPLTASKKLCPDILKGRFFKSQSQTTFQHRVIKSFK